MSRINAHWVDLSRPLTFTFNGQTLRGYHGDTLASALLGCGHMLMGRSFKYHRPRGPLTCSSEEPNALVHWHRRGIREPNTRATQLELYQGLVASSQNAWPSLKCDALAVNDWLSDFLTAGFYYKTFMWPASFWESVYEPLIRRAAGLGRLDTCEDPDHYDKGFLHADILVIGGGPAGLMAALTAARAGKTVIIADENPALGGRLIDDNETDGLSQASALEAELRAWPAVRILIRTTVQGAYDHGVYSALERNTDHLAEPPEDAPRQTLWRIYAQHAVLATGAHERMMAFPHNDRPGIMLAGSVRAYIYRYGVRPGSSAVVFVNNGDGAKTVEALQRAGVTVRALVDYRADSVPVPGVRHFAGGVISHTSGRLRLSHVVVRHQGREHIMHCDLLAVSGGWNPRIQLTCHQGHRPVWNEQLCSFVAHECPSGMQVAGSAQGLMRTDECLVSGEQVVQRILSQTPMPAMQPAAVTLTHSIRPLWSVNGEGPAWVDQQNDVTIKDLKLAHQEGFVSVEHVKRYTTLGMATDQGKNSSVLALGVLSEHTGRSIAELGTTLSRPPYTAVAIGALAGRSRGKAFRPTRLTPSHAYATAHGATFIPVGNWLRAQWFAQPGETHWRESVNREVLAVRSAVGICDVTTLGKIDVQGADAAVFLNIVYANGMLKLPVGKVRYGLMLREDGLVFDDGTAARMAEDHFIVTTTTAQAVAVYRHMEFVHQCLHPELDVQIISTTEAWAQYAVAGPNARALIERMVDGLDVSNTAFPFMACAETRLKDATPARLFRISFSGELAYELAVPTRFGNSLMETLISVGQDLGATPYGTEALGVLRIEKGHAAGNELDGRTSALNLGLGGLVAPAKDSIGRVMASREALMTDDQRLMGLVPVASGDTILAGSHLLKPGAEAVAAHVLGWVSSAAYSPHLHSSIGLCFINHSQARPGDRLRAVSLVDNTDVEVELVSPHFVDPEGERLRV